METEPNQEDSGDNAQNGCDTETASPDQLSSDPAAPENTPDTNENQSEKEDEKTDQSESGTSELLPSDDAKPDSVSGSPRVQFGAGTKERDGSKKGVQRVKRSFKDIVLTEVMKADPQETSLSPAAAALGGPPPKGILKVRSEPVLGSHSEKSYVNKGYEEDAEDPSTSIATTARSAFPFLKRSPRSGSDGHGFADVVDLLIQRTSLDFGGRDVHPFGRDCSIEGIMQASRPKSHSKNSAFSKLVIWFTLMSFLLGAAFGVIFLSENYTAKVKADRMLKASMNSSAL